MPCDYSKYPPDWKAIRARILKRANNCCEFCGLPNYSWIIRSSVDGARYLVLKPDSIYYLDDEPVRLSEIPAEFAAQPDVKVVLTVAHLDHDVTNNDDGNLKALCQRCHLTHDAKVHAQHARETRIERSGQMTFFEMIEKDPAAKALFGVVAGLTDTEEFDL